METIWMVQKAAAMGNWWLASSSPQRACSCITSPAEYFCETSTHPGDSALLQPRFGTLWLLAFSKTKITFEREEISDHRWDSGKYDRAADDNWENCVRSQGFYFEGSWGFIVLCIMFLVCCVFNKCLYFSYYMAGYLLGRLYINVKRFSQSNWLTHSSLYIVTIYVIFFFACRTRMPKIYSLTKFKMLNTILLTIVTMLPIKSPKLTHLVTEKFVSLTSNFPFPTPTERSQIWFCVRI